MFGLLGGLRYFKLDTRLSVDTSSVLQDRWFKASSSGSVTDAIIGIRGNYHFNPKWAFRYYADIGAGQSDFTWQANAGITYSTSDNWDIALTYRHLEWDVGGKSIDDMSFDGPLLGIVYNW